MFKHEELLKILNPSILENIVKDKNNSFYIKKEKLMNKEIWTIGYRIVNILQWKSSSLFREFRGLTYIPNDNKYFLSIHKFFNHKENELVQFPLSNKLEIVEKIDGSLIIPIIINDKIYFRTKGTLFSEQAKKCNEIYQNKDNYIKLIKDLYVKNLQPLFEFTHPDYKIVVDYPIDLKLIQIRNLNTGEYLNYEDMKFIANEYNISIPSKKEIDYHTLLNLQKTEKYIEGFVVKDKNLNGHDSFQKFKTEWYYEKHKLLENITRTDIIIKYILTEQIDDILSKINNNDLKIEIYNIINKFTYQYNSIIEILDNLEIEYQKLGRREFFQKYGNKYPFSYIVTKKNRDKELKIWILKNTRKLRKAKVFLSTKF